MKRIVSILLLLVFLFNVVGYTIVFEVLKWQIKTEMRSGFSINTNELVKLSFPLSEVSSIDFKDEGQEICLDGTMYDIIQTVKTEKDITYYCLDDEKEMMLFAKLSDHVSSNVKNDKPLKNQGAKKQLVDNVIKVFYSNTYFFDLFGKSSVIYIKSPIDLFYSTFKQLNSPPPEAAV